MSETQIEVVTEDGIELTWYFKRCRFGICFDEKLDRDTGWWFVSKDCSDKLQDAIDGRLPDELLSVLKSGYDSQRRITELERHNKLLRQVAATTYKNTKEMSGYCPSCLSLKGHSDTCPYKAARDAGALGDE